MKRVRHIDIMIIKFVPFRHIRLVRKIILIVKGTLFLF